MGLAVGDYDNDGHLDLAFSNVAPNNLLRNRGDGTFEDVSALAGIQRGLIFPSMDVEEREQWTWGTVFFDHDNDGWLDLFFAAGYLEDDRPLMPGAFFRNSGDGTFVDLTASSGLGLEGRARNASIVHFDDDGFVDLFVSNLPDGGFGPYKINGVPWLFHNRAKEMGNSNAWLAITVEGTVSNRDGIGTRLWLTTPDGQTQMREISSGFTHGGGDHRAAHFGLGSNSEGNLVVRWPNGRVQDLGAIAANQKLHLVEPVPDEPKIVIIPRDIDFGIVSLETASETILTIRNNGSRALTVNEIVVSGAGYSIVADPVPFDVAGNGGTKTLTVRYAPTSESNEIGTVEIASNDPDFPLTIVLLNGIGRDLTTLREFRINAGGSDFTDSEGNLFVADKALSPGDFGHSGGQAAFFNSQVSGTTDDLLYQSTRGGSSFSYIFDLIPNGDYQVTLYFIEPFQQSPGRRQFDVIVEDLVGLDNLDLYAEAGGRFVAHTESFPITVADSRLDIRFQAVVGSNAIVSAIAVTPIR
jgi:hypothetical protein